MLSNELIQSYSVKLSSDYGRDVSIEETNIHILQIIHDVCITLSHRHKFGYHSEDDIFQEGYKEAIKVLQRNVYDISKKPLGNFLYVHIHNRLSNLKRKQFFRSEAPCKCCDAFNPGPSPCKRWHEWNRRNESKQRLMRPMPLSGDSNLPAPPSDPSEAVILGELTSYIEARLPADLFEDYLIFKSEGDLPKARRNRVRSVLRTILEDSPYAD